MTDKQKETVLVLARLYANGHIGDGEYTTLMEYVVDSNNITAMPYTPPSIGVPYEPVTPLYDGTSKISYSTNAKEEE